MPQQVDRAKSAQQNLIDLINTGSTYVFTGSEFTIGTPTTYIPTAPETSNTELLLSAIPGSGFIGSEAIRYRRLALGATRPGAKLQYTIAAEDTLETLKESIAQEHNLVSSEFDLQGQWPVQGGSASEFTLTAVTGSLLYTGSITVSVIFP